MCIFFLQPVEENLNQLLKAIRDSNDNPDSAGPQLALINVSKLFIQASDSQTNKPKSIIMSAY